MSKLIQANQPLLLTIAIATIAASVILGGYGVLLVLGGTGGDTEFTFFGQTFKSGSVGVAAIFLATATIVLVIRRALKSADQTVASEVRLQELATFQRPQDGVAETSKMLKGEITLRSNTLTQRKELSAELYENCRQWAKILLDTFDQAVLRWEREGQDSAVDEIMALEMDFMKLDYWSLKSDSPILKFLKGDKRFRAFADACADFYKSALYVKRIVYGEIEASPNRRVTCRDVGVIKMVGLWKKEVETMFRTVTTEYHTIKVIAR